MTRCLVARTAILEITNWAGRTRKATIAFPAEWSAPRLLLYARESHKPYAETVKLVSWFTETNDADGQPLLWLANPDGFKDYARGVVG